MTVGSETLVPHMEMEQVQIPVVPVPNSQTWNASGLIITSGLRFGSDDGEPAHLLVHGPND
jgi:hypothetical protein